MAATTAESSYSLSDGLKVYTQTWKTTLEKPLAYMFFLHGFSDHCNAYYTLFPTLAVRGIEVFSFDQRGWGQTCTTKAQRGLTGPNSQLLQDIDELISPRLDIAEAQNVPLYLMGHSNGGNIALWYAIYGAHHDRLAGVVLESPLLNLHPHVRPWGATVAAGKLAAKLFPNQQLVNKLDPKTMSRDKEVCRRFDEDELCHDTGTLLGILEMLGRGKALQKAECYGKYNENLPLCITHGTGDMVTCYQTSKEFIDNVNVRDKTYIPYDGWYHKLHAELGNDRIKYANDVADWILERAPNALAAPGPGSASAKL